MEPLGGHCIFSISKGITGFPRFTDKFTYSKKQLQSKFNFQPQEDIFKLIKHAQSWLHRERIVSQSPVKILDRTPLATSALTESNRKLLGQGTSFTASFLITFCDEKRLVTHMST